MKDISPERFKLESEIFNSAQFDNFRFRNAIVKYKHEVWFSTECSIKNCRFVVGPSPFLILLY